MALTSHGSDFARILEEVSSKNAFETREIDIFASGWQFSDLTGWFTVYDCTDELTCKFMLRSAVRRRSRSAQAST